MHSPRLLEESLWRERERAWLFLASAARNSGRPSTALVKEHTHTEAKLFCAQVIHRQRSEREGARGHTRPGITLGRQAFRRIFFVPLTSRTWGFCSRLVDKYLFLFPIFFQISERKSLLAVNHQEEPCRRVSSWCLCGHFVRLGRAADVYVHVYVRRAPCLTQHRISCPSLFWRAQQIDRWDGSKDAMIKSSKWNLSIAQC